jgi:hypothetical protein
MTFTKAILALACLMPGTLVAQAAKVTPVPVLTENSIALQEREQHASGNEFLGLRKL